MKHQSRWQTAQRVARRNRKYVWCHPEAKLSKVFMRNVFWKGNSEQRVRMVMAGHLVPCPGKSTRTA